MFKNNYPNKFNLQSDNFNYPNISEENLNFFLNKYQVSNNKEIFSEKFLTSCPLYSENSLTPSSFDLVRRRINRDEAFYSGYNKYGKGKNKFYYNNYPRKPTRCNFYPKAPLKLNSNSELFKKEKPFVKAEEEKNNVINNEEHKNKESKNFGDYMMDDLSGKIWFIKSLQENEKDVKQYGPYDSKSIYEFLKNSYMTLPPQEQKKAGLLIFDIMSDVHYQPESLFMQLENEYTKKESKENAINVEDKH